MGHAGSRGKNRLRRVLGVRSLRIGIDSHSFSTRQGSLWRGIRKRGAVHLKDLVSTGNFDRADVRRQIKLASVPHRKGRVEDRGG